MTFPIAHAMLFTQKGGETMADIGKNIRTLRTQKQMTQDELAEKLFVSRQTVSNYETGRSQPDIDALLRIAEALETNAQYLLYGSPDTNAQMAEKLRTIAASFALAGLAILYHLLWQAHQALEARFLLGLGYLILLVLRPVLLILAGWVVMQYMALLTNIHPLRKQSTRYVFWLIFSLVLAYFILVLPVCCHTLWSSWQVWLLQQSGESYSYSRPFSITPWWDAATAWLIRRPQLVWTLSPIVGALLWLTDRRPTPASEAQKSETATDTM